MFDLAETLGMTVGQLTQVMSTQELDEWALRRKPLAFRRMERMVAQLCAMTAWAAGNKDYEVGDADIYSQANLDAASMLAATGEEMAEDFATSLGGVRVLKLKKHRTEGE